MLSQMMQLNVRIVKVNEVEELPSLMHSKTLSNFTSN